MTTYVTGKKSPSVAKVTERFWQKIAKDDATGCWNWAGRLSDQGYGVFDWHGQPRYAHRFAVAYIDGRTIPDDKQIDHLCRNRACVNPAHLEVVSCRENILRAPDTAGTRNAARTHCPKGHPLSGDTVYIRRRGWRMCRVCAVERSRAWHARKREARA